MPNNLTKSFTAFIGQRILRSGHLGDVAVAVARLAEGTSAVLVFDDATGRIVDLDLRGGEPGILERLSAPPKPHAGHHRRSVSDAPGTQAAEDGPKGRGRPRLGVVAREVTLLPRQWDWLSVQPGGASVTLRRLVEDARKDANPRNQRRVAQEAAYTFMQAIAGDLPGYEEATRALFKGDLSALRERMSGWSEDIRAYALRLASGPADAEQFETPNDGNPS